MTDLAVKPLWRGRSLALVGIVLVALNLRTAVASLSPIVDEITVDIPLSSISIGVLGMLPPICFAVFGILAPVFHRRFGLERVLVIALVMLTAGHLIRAAAGEFTLMAGASALTFAGMGVANVLLPPVVKKYFPDRVGLLTSVYVTVMSIGATLPPLVAVPVADGFGWRVSLGLWSVFAFAAILPWLTIVIRSARSLAARPDVPAEEAEPAVLGRVRHSRVAWALMAIFALTSLNAYAMFAWLPSLLTDRAGLTAGAAGAMLSLYASMGFPVALFIPMLAARLRNVGGLIYVGVAFYVLGYLGLLIAPDTATWLWVAMAGLGPLVFPLVLVLINLRTRTHEAAVALSGFVQGGGYGISAAGPLVVGVLHQFTGDWTAPLVLLLVSALLIVLGGLVVSRPRMIEDDWFKGTSAG